jgi:hypothetical protein
MMEHLMRDAGAPPFNLADLDLWIIGLKFTELAGCDAECDHIYESLKDGQLENYYPVFGQDIRWQLITRCECALDFCRGRVEKRQEYAWNQDERIVYHWLLIDFWRQCALHWAAKTGRCRRARIGFMSSFWRHVNNPELN